MMVCSHFSFHTDISTVPIPSTIHIQWLITIRLRSIISRTMLREIYYIFSFAQVKGLGLYEVWFIPYISVYTKVKTKPPQAKAMILAAANDEQRTPPVKAKIGAAGNDKHEAVISQSNGSCCHQCQERVATLNGPNLFILTISSMYSPLSTQHWPLSRQSMANAAVLYSYPCAPTTKDGPHIRYGHPSSSICQYWMQPSHSCWPLAPTTEAIIVTITAKNEDTTRRSRQSNCCCHHHHHRRQTPGHHSRKQLKLSPFATHQSNCHRCRHFQQKLGHSAPNA